jgi:hypothetical protein
MLRVLGRDDEERFRQRMRDAIERYVLFLHRLEQRALRLWRGAIDLVGEDELRKERSGVEDEALLVAIEDRVAEDVRGQQIARELDAAEIEAEGTRQRVGKRRLADPRDVLDQ